MRPVLALHRDEGERRAQDEQVGQQVGQKPQHDHERGDDRRPDTAKGAPGVEELDQEERQERQPGQPCGRGQATQQACRHPALAARGQHCAKREGAEDSLRVADE